MVNGIFFYFAKRNWKKLKRYISLGSINKLVSFVSIIFITLGPKTDQVQMMMHYSNIAKFLQMLKTNMFGVEMNFTVVYRLT